MARGWESKSVEEQMATVLQRPEAGSGYDFKKAEGKRLAMQESITRKRQIQSLNLQRENILSQKTSHPARRAALEAALGQIEAQIHSLS
jgi:hypothetical protein